MHMVDFLARRCPVFEILKLHHKSPKALERNELNSLPPETRSNASTDTRIWESGHATLNPLDWHCYRFALGHLFNHKLSPYDEKEAKLIFSRHASVQAHASTATPHTHPLLMLPAQEWTNRTVIGHEPLICSKMCFTKTELVQ